MLGLPSEEGRPGGRPRAVGGRRGRGRGSGRRRCARRGRTALLGAHLVLRARSLRDEDRGRRHEHRARTRSSSAPAPSWSSTEASSILRASRSASRCPTAPCSHGSPPPRRAASSPRTASARISGRPRPSRSRGDALRHPVPAAARRRRRAEREARRRSALRANGALRARRRQDRRGRDREIGERRGERTVALRARSLPRATRMRRRAQPRRRPSTGIAWRERTARSRCSRRARACVTPWCSELRRLGQ